MLIGLAAGALAGAINGLGITKGRLQPFIMTLGMLVIARGVTMTYADGKPIPLGDRGDRLAWLGTGESLGLPVPVWILAALRRHRRLSCCATRRSAATSTRSATTSRRHACRASTPTG